MQQNNVLNKFYFCRTFFLIASYQISQNVAILINHEKIEAKIKFVKYNIFLHFKLFPWNIIFDLSN